MKKTCKIIQVVLTVLLYVAQLTFMIGLILSINNSNDYTTFYITTYSSLGLLAVLLILGIINIILFSNAIKKSEDNSDISKFMMIIKIAQIPYYIINFLFWCLIFIGTLNPFLMIFGFVGILIAMFCTYLTMLFTSIPNAIVMLKNEKNKIYSILCGVSQFFFTFDLIGAIVYYNLNKTKKSE